MTIDVFSYGSNMCLERIRARIPSAVAIACGHVSGRRLLFHKRGRDGSAKADAFCTGDPEHRVYGVVVRIARTEKAVLDVHEHLGIGYDEEEITVTLDGGGFHRAWIYAARSEAIEPALKPFSWYRDFVLAGARQHALPADYIQQIERFECIVDPDRRRHAASRKLIALPPGVTAVR